MIHRRTNAYRLLQDLVPRIEVAHESCTNIVAVLRAADTTVFTGVVSDAMAQAELGAGRKPYSALGWVQHFTAERTRLMALRTDVLPMIQRVFPELETPATDYVTTIPTIVTAIQTAIDLHATNEPLTAGERNALANAIEAELEA